MPFFGALKQMEMGALGWMELPFEVDKIILTTDDPKLFPPCATASGSPSLTWRLTLGPRVPTCTETVSPPESTIWVKPDLRREGDWLVKGDGEEEEGVGRSDTLLGELDGIL